MAAEFKVPSTAPIGNENRSSTSETQSTHKKESSNSEETHQLPYTEPSWSGLPASNTTYKLSIIKNGVEVSTISLNKKPYITIGRLPVCDVHLEHPSISRYHAVLQYRPMTSSTAPESTLFSNNPKDAGFYIYDLSSVHGTYLNKTKIEPRCYYRVRVGQTMKFGGSSRLFVLDQSTDSVQEIVEAEAEKEREEILQKQEEYNQLIAAAEEERAREEQMKEALGATWGLLTDDDLMPLNERKDMKQSDPQREAYYMEDPKKALNKFFEREGLELEYETEESDTPSGKMYTVRILLPIEDLSGEPIYAEGTQESKKKEAVVKCALEACRLLDAEDVLRQPMKNYKRKKRNWEENDYYDSDEDNFLDRTGDIDKKRKTRMKRVGKAEETVETYESLMTKLTEVKAELVKLHSVLDTSTKDINSEGDSLDSFMKNISSQLDKRKQSEIKLRIHQLKKEEEYLNRLVKAAQPCKLPSIEGETNLAEKLSSPTAVSSTSSSLPVVNEQRSGHDDRKKSKSESTHLSGKSDAPLSSPPEQKLSSHQVTSSQQLKHRSNPPLKKTKLIGPSFPKITSSTHHTRDQETTKSSMDNIVEEDEEDEEKYDSWLPPENQSGDGRTSLNDKFGY